MEDCLLFEYGPTVDGEEMVIFHSWKDIKTSAAMLVDSLRDEGFDARLSEGDYDNDVTINVPHVEDDEDEDNDGEEFERLAETLHGLLDASDSEKSEGKTNIVEANSISRTVKWLKEHFDEETRNFEFRFDLLLDHRGWDMSFSDEYDRCNECYRLIHTEAEHHGDHGRFQMVDDQMMCRECIGKNPDDYVTWYKDELAAGTVQSFILNPADIGLVEISDRHGPIKFERGLHRGQRDNPKTTAKFLLKQLKDRERPEEEDDIENIDLFVFDVSTGQFDVSWTIWCHPKLHDDMQRWLTAGESEIKDREGPGDYAERALRKVSLQNIKRGPGETLVVDIDTENKTTTAKVVPQEQAFDKSKE